MMANMDASTIIDALEGDPDNAAAKQRQELRSEQTVTPLHEQHHLYLFLRLNNSETFVES